MPVILRKKVLVVDDDFTNVALLKRYVVSAGFDVDTAYNGKEALEKVAKELPDLILLDSIMPEMTGFEVCRQLRADERAKKVPILMVTGLKTEADSLQARMSGANEVLVKPVSEKDLIDRIRAHLKSTFR